MNIVQISKTNIKSIAAFVLANKNSCIGLVNNFKGIVSRQEIDGQYTKVIIKNDAIIKVVVIDCQNDKSIGIMFYGQLDITYNDLVELLGKGDEYHERYDNTVEFVFRDVSDVRYNIKCFVLSDEMKKDGWQNEQLGNVAIHLM